MPLFFLFLIFHLCLLFYIFCIFYLFPGRLSCNLLAQMFSFYKAYILFLKIVLSRYVFKPLGVYFFSPNIETCRHFFFFLLVKTLFPLIYYFHFLVFSSNLEINGCPQISVSPGYLFIFKYCTPKSSFGMCGTELHSNITWLSCFVNEHTTCISLDLFSWSSHFLQRRVSF